MKRGTQESQGECAPCFSAQGNKETRIHCSPRADAPPYVTGE